MNFMKIPGLLGALFLATALFGGTLTAQEKFTVKGEVIDSATRQGVQMATVSIMDTEGRAIKAFVTDGNGKFETILNEKGDFQVAFSSLGYTTAIQPLKITQAVTDLAKIELIAGLEMEEIVVSVVKPLIRSEVDKIAYSVEADPEAPISSALDILRKVPLITVDGEDNILLQGSSNYRVLMNGKSSSMMNNKSTFKQMMRSMPASSIKDIEVITNPSSRYEAEGVGGIINIITNRQASDNAYSGTVGASYSTQESIQGYTYVSAKLGKLTLSANVVGAYIDQRPSTSTSFRENYLNDERRFTNSDTRSELEAKLGQMNLEASYEIDTFNLITLSAWGYRQNVDNTSHMTTRISDQANVLNQHYNYRGISNYKYGSLSGNIDYQRTFRKPDRVLTFSYKLDNSPERSRSETDITGIQNFDSYYQLSDDDSFMREHTFQVDYANPINAKNSYEIGAKYILRQNESDPEAYIRYNPSDPWEVDYNRLNSLDYDQHILAAYGAYTYKLAKYSFKAGARLETTWNDGVATNISGDTHFDNNLFNIVPYATISYVPKPTNRYSLSYTQRLSRPSIWYLNPYVDNTNPEYIRYGNPDLDAEIAHQFSLTYGIYSTAHTLNLTANTTFTNNPIQSYSWINDDGVSETTYLNIGSREYYGLSAYYSFRKGTKFSLNTNLSGNYSTMEKTGEQAVKNDGFSYNAYLSMRFGLWKDGAITGYAQHSSPRVMLQGESSGFTYYGFSVNQRFFKQKLSMTLGITTPFQKYRTYWSETDAADYFSRNDSRNFIRNVSFNVSYNFGKTGIQVKRARRGIQNDDVKAGEGGSGSSATSSGGAAQ